ncbi:unnamed protein product [Tetraodon nigroviridis]|uniref:(spotted green pufferfish) hypothetical protein n=1 Tax=Tetraodon nigroviridis TaxID=99883 RepID=Q4SNP3_TETNG|nr:unnamed protein product [Tetraodon nigroviridis]
MVEIPSQGRVSTLQHPYTFFIKQTCELPGAMDLRRRGCAHDRSTDTHSTLRLLWKSQKQQTYRCSCSAEEESNFSVCCEDKSEADAEDSSVGRAGFSHDEVS